MLFFLSFNRSLVRFYYYFVFKSPLSFSFIHSMSKTWFNVLFLVLIILKIGFEFLFLFRLIIILRLWLMIHYHLAIKSNNWVLDGKEKRGGGRLGNLFVLLLHVKFKIKNAEEYFSWWNFFSFNHIFKVVYFTKINCFEFIIALYF